MGWEGIGLRILSQIHEIGYANAQQFAVAKRYPPSYLYDWIKEKKRPSRRYIDRLATDLGVNPWWLEYGDVAVKRPQTFPVKPPKTTRGVSPELPRHRRTRQVTRRRIMSSAIPCHLRLVA